MPPCCLHTQDVEQLFGLLKRVRGDNTELRRNFDSVSARALVLTPLHARTLACMYSCCGIGHPCMHICILTGVNACIKA
eukprot:362671-Chlamydomonas_euryale.AAC.3